MKRSILIVSVLTLMLLCALSAGSPAEARRCGHEWCVTMYNECEASCNGNRQCIKACQRDYNECLCSNCGLCSGELPRAAPQDRTARVAAIPGTTKGQFDFEVTRWQTVP